MIPHDIINLNAEDEVSPISEVGCMFYIHYSKNSVNDKVLITKNEEDRLATLINLYWIKVFLIIGNFLSNKDIII